MDLLRRVIISSLEDCRLLQLQSVKVSRSQLVTTVRVFACSAAHVNNMKQIAEYDSDKY